MNMGWDNRPWIVPCWRRSEGLGYSLIPARGRVKSGEGLGDICRIKTFIYLCSAESLAQLV
nr:MAG TPA: hypothetical protein [Caudoviricetes sp.]